MRETNDPYGGTRCLGEGEICGVFELFDEAPPQNAPLYHVFTREDFSKTRLKCLQVLQHDRDEEGRPNADSGGA
ncbi:MAG: hypothetical protein ACTSUQ_04510 [Candidatus Freyarchaeota archaeon]